MYKFLLLIVVMIVVVVCNELPEKVWEVLKIVVIAGGILFVVGCLFFRK